MNASSTRRAFNSAMLLGLSSIALGVRAQTQGPIKIGALFSLTGPAAPFGIPERDIVAILADKINAEGGINGRKIEMVYHDDQTNPTETARGASKLIQQDNVVAIVGPTIGSGALAMLPLASRAKVPVVAPVGTLPVTARNSGYFPWVFRACPDDELMVSTSLEQLVVKPGYKRLALMYQEDAYGKNAATFAERFAKEKGLEVVTQASAPATAVDLSAAATRIRGANPDCVLLWTSGPAMAAAFVRTARQIGLTAPMVGSGGILQRSFLEAAGPAAEGVTSMNFALWEEPSPKLKALSELMRASGKTPSGFGELLGATAMVTLAEGLRRVKGTITGEALRDALEGICGLDNPYADMSVCYGPDDHEAFSQEALRPVVVRDGKFRWATKS